MIIQSVHNLISVEIKSSQTFDHNFLKNLHYFQELTSKAVHGFLIYDGEIEQPLEKITLLNYRQTQDVF